MRPNTSSSGIFSTKRSRPVSTSMLTRMLVPKPKNAFQSPGTQSFGLKSAVVTAMSLSSGSMQSRAVPRSALADRRDDIGRASHPAENAALRLDHFQAHVLELGEVGAHAILGDEAVVAAVVGLADRGVDAHFGGDAGDDELGDAAMLQDRMEVGGVESALAGLVDDRLARRGIELGNDVVAGLAAHQDAAHRSFVADRGLAAAAHLLGRRQVREVRPMALAGVHRQETSRAPRQQQPAVGLDRAAQLRDVVAQHLAKAAGLEKI